MPTMPVWTDHDYQSVNRPINVPQATAAGQPVVFEQLEAIRKGIAWKDSCRVGAFVNINTASPGATINGVTMAAGDRVLLTAQTTASQNGIYIWSAAASALTRADDSDTALALEGAVVGLEEGTSNANTTWRQTAVNFVLGTGSIAWETFNPAAPAATEATPGIIEVGTLAEVDAGTLDNVAVTPLKLKTTLLNAVTKEFVIGDGTATSFTCTHNFNTFKVGVEVVETTGSRRSGAPEIRRTSVNVVTVLMNPPPATGSIAVYVTRWALV
jgi:hypothetical protein